MKAYDLLSTANYFWERYENIDRCVDSAEIYKEFPALEKAIANYKLAKRAVDAELALLRTLTDDGEID